ncbi:esterase/lipase family protein [Streptomyces viridochromogenes]|uniref:esterase/lipase family protein n=1 Tax=Streptomyces viridochromogenes TaxID=1938 RepID=UPI00069CE89B|nr:alpha/beta fold hydrolase [Streptomyces viridochromogenes]KOG11763.1 lipase [Streptomyces viridochromogenes]KOG24025.1 lipase [Streptomyces viridochromogenes]
MSHRPVRPAPRSRLIRRWATATVSAVTALALGFPGTSVAADGPTPPGAATASAPEAFLRGTLQPDASPPGANDWKCRPTAAHPRPVVLLHATLTNAHMNWSMLSPLLKEAGYCVFAPNYGGRPGVPFKATRHIPDSAREIARYVDRVLDATGARQVDLVGHSQGGGVLPRWYLRFEGGTNPAKPSHNKVRRLIGLAPSNHGATLSGLGTLTTELGLNPTVSLVAGQAYADQMVGSEVNTTLDRGGDTQPGVDYTVIATRYDEAVTPYRNQFLKAGPRAKVRNITLQDICPQDLSEHISIAYDSNALQIVLNALDPAHARSVHCRLSAPLIGG